MATTLQWTKTGLRLVCETSRRAMPRTSLAYPLPEGITPLIQAAWEIVPRSLIRVTTIAPEGLAPGTWTLEWASYRGERPAALTWTSVGISAGPLDWTLESPQSPVSYVFRVRQAGVCYPEVVVLVDVAADSVLGIAEKPRVILDYQAALADRTLLVSRAQSAGVDASAYLSACDALQAYMSSLVPAYDDLTADTPIDRAAWRSVWGGHYAAKTALLISLQTATVSAVDGVATAALDLATNASAPTVDGLQRAAGETLLLTAQTDASANGVYRLQVATASGTAGDPIRASQSYAGGTAGSFTDDAAVRDVDGTGALDLTTYGVLTTSKTGRGSAYYGVVFSRWGATGVVSGTLELRGLVTRIYPYNPSADMDADITVDVSTDDGATWSYAGGWGGSPATDEAASLSYALTSVDLGRLRVRVQAVVSAIGTSSSQTVTSRIKIQGLWIAPATQATDNWSLARVASVTDGSLWYVRKGTTFGAKAWTARVASGGAITLEEALLPYEPPLGAPVKDGQVLKADAAGARYWADEGGGGASLAAREATLTTEATSGTVSLGKTFQLLSEAATASGRLRLYRTAAALAADAGRPAGQDPDPGAGVLCDDNFLSARSVEGPDVTAHSGPDGLCHWSWSGPVGAVLTFRVLTLEA